MDPINLSVFSGDLICLMGINGCGKSTFFKTVASLVPPLSGEVHLNGQNIATMSAKEKSHLMSFVFSGSIGDQHLLVDDILIFSRYPYSNFWGKLSKADKLIIEDVVELLGLSDFRYKTLGELSDGQKQKVWIARAFVQDTPLVFLDEPTNFLDIPHRLDVMRILRLMARQKNKAVIFSSHDWESALSTASWLWLVNDKKLAKGVPEDFILNSLLHKVFSKDNFIFDHERGVFKEKIVGAKKIILDVKKSSFEQRHWTIHALTKVGFLCELEGHAQIRLENDVWIVEEKTGPKICQSLEELLNTLGHF